MDRIAYYILYLQRAGEVYGEKAVLATEVGELQSRLRSLSDERDKSLAILDEVLPISFIKFIVHKANPLSGINGSELTTL